MAQADFVHPYPLYQRNILVRDDRLVPAITRLWRSGRRLWISRRSSASWPGAARLRRRHPCGLGVSRPGRRNDFDDRRGFIRVGRSFFDRLRFYFVSFFLFMRRLRQSATPGEEKKNEYCQNRVSDHRKSAIVNTGPGNMVSSYAAL